MATHAEQNEENQAHSLQTKASRLGGPVQLADNRPAAIAQRRQQELVSSSSRLQPGRTLQARLDTRAGAPTGAASTSAPAAPPRENRTGLPDNLKAGVESLSGHSLDDVRVHYNSARPAELQAHAYAQGTDIHVAPGQEQHLPHEAWHVVQQAQGRVQPTMQLKGVGVNDDAGLEKEADVMGARAVQLAADPAAVAQSKPQTAEKAPAAVVQGYFTLAGQKTNDATMFKVGASDEEKRTFVWDYVLLPELNKKAITSELIAEYKERLLNFALEDKTKYSFEGIATRLQEIGAERLRIETEKAAERERAAVPLADRESPAALPKIVGPPTLAGKEKHSAATYKRGTGEAATEETFSSDDYTKGPAKRRRGDKAATTPKGSEAQTWTRQGVLDSIRNWSGDVPLARHLAGFIWPLLENKSEGKKWELKFREIDRLTDFRDKEAQSKVITIIRKTDPTETASFDRKDYTTRARLLLKAALLAGTPHPADQQDVLFYDTLLKAAVNAGWQNAASTTFDLNANYKATGEGGLSMILTHWRPILFFDWILAEDVLNNASDS